jgi:hypothetical protein
LVEDKLEKHHIVPNYRCVELVEEGILVGSYKIRGVEFYFKENMVQVTKEDHAYIHWGYFNDNLEALFKHVKPQQWIIDLIPRKDKRDLAATKITANGVIEDIDMSGENNPFWGKKHTEETKQKMSKALKGKKRRKTSEETKQKMSEALKGKKHTVETKQKISETLKGQIPWNKGKKHTVETKQKISETLKGQGKKKTQTSNSLENFFG